MLDIVINMDEAQLQTVEQIKTFLKGAHDIVLKILKAGNYEFVERALKRLGCALLPRRDKAYCGSRTYDRFVTVADNAVS